MVCTVKPQPKANELFSLKFTVPETQEEWQNKYPNMHEWRTNSHWEDALPSRKAQKFAIKSLVGKNPDYPYPKPKDDFSKFFIKTIANPFNILERKIVA
ncbi:MAG: hypothetical protein AAF969_14875 [Bacteroidota bacterium]